MKQWQLVIAIILLAIALGYSAHRVYGQWRENLNAARYQDKRVNSFSETQHNGDEVLIIYFEGGRKLTIRARQSHLIYINQ